MDCRAMQPGRITYSKIKSLGRRAATLTVFLLLVIAITSTSAMAEEAQKPGITIHNMEEASTRVVVPLKKSVVIETQFPIERCQAVSPDIAYVQVISPTQTLITGLDYGTTQVIAWADGGKRHIFEVAVEIDLDQLKHMIGEIDPLSDTEVHSVMGNIVLTGVVSDAETAERIVNLAGLFAPSIAEGASRVQNQLTVAGEQQVLLRCTVAEVNKTAIRTLGINGFMAGENFQDVFLVNQLGTINPVNIGAAADVNILDKIPFLTGSEGIPLSTSSTLSLGFPKVQMQVFIKAMADNSLLRILAEPNLVATSGETASFLAGGEFPIPVPQSGASTGAITIDWKEYGVKLNFTPVVLRPHLIRLRVSPEVSEQDYSGAITLSGYAVPALTQRKAETTVEVGDGQTIAIAGLLDDEIRGIVSRVPGIGDVPVLGALFRSTEYRRKITELVILVTPEVIAPMNPDQVPAVPGAFLSAPDDFELYALGMLEGEDTEDTSGPSDTVRTTVPARVGTYWQGDEMSLHGPWGHENARSLN